MCFPNRPESVRMARRFVELAADVYGIAHVAETAALLVSELATNATRHARGMDGDAFTVAVSQSGDRIRVEVRDLDPRLPVMRSFDVLDEDGRDLYLVKELADRYGAHAVPQGKTVWFELVAVTEQTS
jgi:anti-sigma regulatory factor (Ser/Thr protein kinase)